MPIATSKWDRRCARRSTEQRAQDKARLLGKPSGAKPTHNARPIETGEFHGPRYQYAAIPLVVNGIGIPTGAYLTEGTYSVGQRYLTAGLPYSVHQPVFQYYLNNEYIYDPAPGVTMPISMDAQFAWNQWHGMMTQTVLQPYAMPQNQIWNTWNTGQPQSMEFTTVPFTPDQVAAQERAMTGRQRVVAKAREEQVAADNRALQLFLHTLKPEERQTYEREKCIYVKGSRGRRYRIRCGTSQSHNVEWLDDQGNRLATLCAHPGERVPNPDCWMVQKLTLEHDEDHFTSTCNYNGQRPADMARV